MNRSGFPPLSRSFATAIAGIAVLAATVVAIGLATGPMHPGEAALQPLPTSAPAADGQLDRPDGTSAATDALTDFGEGGAVRLLSDLGILALQGGPARDMQVGGTQRGMVVRAMPPASAATASESNDGSFVTRPNETREAGHTAAAAYEYLPSGQRDGAPGSAAEQHDEARPVWFADLSARLLGWFGRLHAN